MDRCDEIQHIIHIITSDIDISSIWNIGLDSNHHSQISGHLTSRNNHENLDAFYEKQLRYHIHFDYCVQDE